MQISATSGSPYALSPSSKQSSLTSEQSEKLTSILSNYESNNFSESDFSNVNKELKSAGIRPSDDVKKAFEAKGINISQFAKGPEGNNAAGQAGGAKPPQGPLSSRASNSEDVSDIFSNFLSKAKSNSVNSQDSSKLLDLLQSMGGSTTGVYVDQTA